MEAQATSIETNAIAINDDKGVAPASVSDLIVFGTVIIFAHTSTSATAHETLLSKG